LITRIDHVQVAAPPGCEPQARAFYGELLGLSVVDKPTGLAGRGGVWFALGDQQLHVGVTDDFVPARKAHPALAVDSAHALEALARELEAGGYAVSWDGALAPARRLHTVDPFGNRIELLVRE
jgi:catechol 2,3-dioxygenase-like lactoylglutathione lyase family enzyme